VAVRDFVRDLALGKELVRIFVYCRYMDNDLAATAQQFYAVRLINGAIPEVWIGGLLDGLEYFPLTLDGVDYLLTADGLFTPPEQQTTPTE
jgi:hypothetical protein